MTLEHSNNRHLGTMGFDHLPYGSGPQFTNPWAPANGQMFGASVGSGNQGFEQLPKQPTSRATTASLPYSSVPAPAPSMNANYESTTYPQGDLVGVSQDLVNQSRQPYDQSYSAAPTSVGSFVPTSAPYVNSYGSVAHAPQQEEPRRLSQS